MSKILLVEQNRFIRESLLQILQDRFMSLTVKDVHCYENCLDEMGDFRPDILVLGIPEGESRWPEDLRRIREQFPATVIVLFTDYENEEYRKKAIQNGANHIISKEMWTGSEIMTLMKTILATRHDLSEDGR